MALYLGSKFIAANLTPEAFVNSGQGIADSQEDRKEIPTAWAVKEFGDSRYLPAGEAFDPTEMQDLLNMLKSMVSDSDEVIYLKSDGGDSAGDGSKERPFKTLDAAVKKAKKRKFIGSSICYIRLLDDMMLDTDQTISIYHPDLVQTKQFVI